MRRAEEEERREQEAETETRRRRGWPNRRRDPESEDENHEDVEPQEAEPREEENTEPVPVGDPVKVTSKGKKQKKHYASFEYEGNTFELEDPVLLTPEDRTQKPYVAILKDVTETEGSLYVTGQWFYRPEEADKKEGGNWVARDTRELFYSFHIDDVPAESVMHKCVVHFIPQHKQIPSQKQHPGFIVQKVYDAVEKKLWNLTDKDYEDNKQQEIDLLVKKTIDRIGQLPDLEPEETPLENNYHLSHKRGLRKKPVNPIDVTREPPVGKSEQFAKAETPGSDKLRNYAILVRYKVLTGDQYRDRWLDKLVESIPLASKEIAGASADPDPAGKISINGSPAKDAGSTETEKSYGPDVVIDIMVALERSAYEALGMDFGKYNQKLRQLQFNIKNSSKLRRRLMDKELDPPVLLTMSPDELKAGLTSAEKTSEPEESTKLQMTHTRCQRCSEKKVGTIHAGHGDRYQIKDYPQPRSTTGRGISGRKRWCSCVCTSSTDVSKPGAMEAEDDALSQLSMVQFNVNVGGRSLSMQRVLECTRVKELIESCCSVIGIKEPKDFYGVLCGKNLSDEKLLCQYPIHRDSIVSLTSRLRGGQVETYRAKFSKPDVNLFYSVNLSEQLQNPALVDENQNVITSVVKLRRCTRYWIKEVFIFFTGKHRENLCYEGAFGVDDILFENKKVHIRAGITPAKFSSNGCKLDYQSLGNILKELKTSDGYHSQHFAQLLSYLERCPLGKASRSDIAISYLINHPAIEHYMDKMKQIMLMDNLFFRMHVDPNIPVTAKNVFTKGMGRLHWWVHLETCPEMNRVLSFESQTFPDGSTEYNPLYTEDSRGCIHYSNNFLKHAKNDLGMEEIEAAYSINLPNFLPSFLASIAYHANYTPNFAQHIRTILDLIRNDLADPQSAVG